MSVQDDEGISTDAVVISPSERPWEKQTPSSVSPSQPKSLFSPVLALSSLVPSTQTGKDIMFTNPGFPFNEYLLL